MTEPRRVRTQAERDTDGTAWRAVAHTRPGYATYPHTQPGDPSWWRRDLPPETAQRLADALADAAPFIQPRDPNRPEPHWRDITGVDPEIWVTTEQIAPPRRRWWHRYTRRAL